MGTAEIDCSKLRFELLIAKQERDEGYKERDMFKQFYLKTSQNLVRRYQ